MLRKRFTFEVPSRVVHILAGLSMADAIKILRLAYEKQPKEERVAWELMGVDCDVWVGGVLEQATAQLSQDRNTQKEG